MIELSIILTFIIVTFMTGNYFTKRHLASLKVREEELAHIPVVTDPALGPERTLKHFTLIEAHATIAADYFRGIWASLREFFGGSVGAYEKLIDRARREAILRLKKKAEQMGACAVVDVRFESTEAAYMMAEIYVYGTAVFTKTPLPKKEANNG